jgi:hypothetical protein
LDNLKEELTDEETSLLKSNIDDGLQPLEAQLAKQREFAESAEKIIDRQFEVIALPALEECKQVVHAYHALSRNTKQGPARALNRNWTNQPHITRRYYGAVMEHLSRVQHEWSIAHKQYQLCYQSANQSTPWSRDALSDLFFHALSCSARKDSYQMLSAPRSAWSKRVNPSSGGLHPVECHVLLPPELSGSETAQVLHYAVQNHGLEHRAQLTSELWQHFTAHSWPHAAALVLLSTLDWREIWKYGERAWRYVQLDVGHALAALQFAARAHGWSVVPVTSVTGATLMTDAQVCTLFGLSDARPESSTSAGGPTLGHCAELEHERPAVLLALIPHVIDVSEYLTAVNKLELDWSAVAQVPYQGNASQASWMHHHWHSIAAIDHVTRITQRTRSLIEASGKYPHVQHSALSVADERLAGEVLRTRRSALEYLPQGGVTWPQFRYMLAHLLNQQVWQSTDQSWGRHIHCALYIHRVEGLVPGYYVLPRTLAALDQLRGLAPNAQWSRPECASDEPDLPLYLLHPASEEVAREVVKEASCHQKIAETASFVLSMFTDLHGALTRDAPAIYRQLHWECGMMGQVLYQDATALALMATGLGCFLDDLALQPFELAPHCAALYHFAVGPGPASHYLAYNYERSFGEIATADLHALP